MHGGSVLNRGECSKICNDMRNCISFEWWGKSNPHLSEGKNYCQASSSCTYAVSEESDSKWRTDMYVKGNSAQNQILIALLNEIEGKHNEPKRLS